MTSLHSPELAVLPATRGQQRFWAVEQLTPGSTAFNMPLAWRLEGEARAEGIIWALNRLIERQESLRTSFRMTDGTLSQIVHQPFSIALTIEDLRALPEPERAAACQASIQAASETVLDPARLPLLEARWIQLASRESILTVTLHHLICDGWSNGVLLREFAELYGAWSQNLPPALPELPLQYGDWAVWQNDRVEAGEFAPSLDFWRARLNPLPPPPALPVDRPSVWRGQPGRIESLLLPVPLSQSIRELCRQLDVTPYHVLLTAFQLLVSEFSGLDHFLLGSPFANRNQPDLQDLVGLFANPQFVVADLRNIRTFHEALRRVREETLAAAEHAEVPFELIVDSLPQGIGAAHIRFPVYFIYQRAFMQPASLPGLEIVPLRSVSPGAQFDWMMGVVERKEGLRLQLEYNAGAFEVATVRSALESFCSILERACANPEATLRSLSRKPFPRPPALVSPAPLLVETAFARPRWSTLEESSARWTGYLSELGVQPGDRVALAIPRGETLLSATVAVWRLGASAAWIDIEESVAVQAAQEDECGARWRVRGVEEEVALSEPALVWNLARPESEALWLRRPLRKPLVLTHRKLSAMLHELAAAIGIDANDRLMSLAPLSSELAILEHLLPLAVGAELVTAGEPARERLVNAGALLALHGATVVLARDATLLPLPDGYCPKTIVSGAAAQAASPSSPTPPVPANAPRRWSLLGWAELGEVIAVAEDQGFSLLPSADIELINRFGQPAGWGVPAQLMVDGRETGITARWSALGKLLIVEAPAWTGSVLGPSMPVVATETYLAGRAQAKRVFTRVTSVSWEVALEADATESDRVGYWLAELTAHVPPLRVIAADPLPVLPDGRCDWSRCAAPAERSVSTAKPWGQREEELQTILAAQWREVLHLPAAGLDDDFFSLGGSSLSALRLVTRLSELMGRDVKLSALATHRTVRRMAEHLCKTGEDQPLHTMVTLQAEGHAPPLFCIYGLFLYFPLAEQFRGERPVFGVYLPEEFDLIRSGLKVEESVLASVPALASRYVALIREKQPQGPYHLAGESFGGVVALEAARQLREQGAETGLVALLDSYAPGAVHRKQGLARAATHARRVFSSGLQYLQEKARHRVKANLLEEAPHEQDSIDAIRQRARTIAMRHYAPTPYDGPVALFRAQDRDPFETDDRESLWGWRRILSGPVSVHEVPGDHLGILRPPNVSLLAGSLRTRLRETETLSGKRQIAAD